MQVSQTSQTSAFGPNLLKISMSLHRVWCEFLSPFHEEQGYLVFETELLLEVTPLFNAFMQCFLLMANRVMV